MTNEPHVDSVDLDKPLNSDSHDDDVFRNTTENDEPKGDGTENKDAPIGHEVDEQQQHPTESSQAVDNKDELPPPPPQPVERPVAVAATAAAYDKYEAMQPRLKKFLKIYQQSSKNNLGGPTENDIENSLNSKPLVPQLSHNIASLTADTHVTKSDDKSSIIGKY